MRDLEHWLQGTVLERLAFLIAVNDGNWTVKQFGNTQQSNSNRYGRVGLLVNEAFELAYLDGAFKALAYAFPHQEKAARERLDREIKGTVIEVHSIKELTALEKRINGKN